MGKGIVLKKETTSTEFVFHTRREIRSPQDWASWRPQNSVFNGMVCAIAFCQGHALLRICLWKKDSQLWGTANVFKPAHHCVHIKTKSTNGKTVTRWCRSSRSKWMTGLLLKGSYEQNMHQNESPHLYSKKGPRPNSIKDAASGVTARGKGAAPWRFFTGNFFLT